LRHALRRDGGRAVPAQRRDHHAPHLRGGGEGRGVRVPVPEPPPQHHGQDEAGDGRGVHLLLGGEGHDRCELPADHRSDRVTN